MNIVNIADLRDPDDPQGRSYREVNRARTHTIPVGTLVELTCEDYTGARLFVVWLGRDCDQTPLYYLSHDPEDTTEQRPGWRNPSWCGGFAEASMAVVRLPEGGDSGVQNR
jgi:hypothetical protein